MKPKEFQAEKIFPVKVIRTRLLYEDFKILSIG